MEPDQAGQPLHHDGIVARQDLYPDAGRRQARNGAGAGGFGRIGEGADALEDEVRFVAGVELVRGARPRPGGDGDGAQPLLGQRPHLRLGRRALGRRPSGHAVPAVAHRGAERQHRFGRALGDQQLALGAVGQHRAQPAVEVEGVPRQQRPAPRRAGGAGDQRRIERAAIAAQLRRNGAKPRRAIVGGAGGIEALAPA